MALWPPSNGMLPACSCSRSCSISMSIILGHSPGRLTGSCSKRCRCGHQQYFQARVTLLHAQCKPSSNRPNLLHVLQPLLQHHPQGPNLATALGLSLLGGWAAAPSRGHCHILPLQVCRMCCSEGNEI
jgi:hypothetical protein